MKMPFNHLYQYVKDFDMKFLDAVCKLTTWGADTNIRYDFQLGTFFSRQGNNRYLSIFLCGGSRRRQVIKVGLYKLSRDRFRGGKRQG